jgi:hypothetical protein
MKPALPDVEVACQQLLEANNTIFSIQWVVIPSTYEPGMNSVMLLQLYSQHIRRFTLGLVIPVETAEGVEFRLAGLPLSLISFTSSVHEAHENSDCSRLHITGGILVEPGESYRGELLFKTEQTPSGLKLTLQLSGFCPLMLGNQKPSFWRKRLYRYTQGYLHRLITVRFLARVHGRVTGADARTRVVRVALRQGEET